MIRITDVSFQIKKLILGSHPGHFSAHVAEVIANYNNTYHRTIRMTPLEALRALTPSRDAPPEAWRLAATVREEIRHNIARMGVQNLSRVKAEFAKTLELISVGDTVIVCVEVPKKKHSPSHGRYVIHFPCFRMKLTVGTQVDCSSPSIGR